MFKFFNVSNEENKENISIDVNNNIEIEDENVGQIALDILESESLVVIIAPLAWVDISNVDISISKNVLTISWERNRPDIYNSTSKILIEECFFGPYSRSVILPENLDFNKIRAVMENNLLIIEIPKLKLDSFNIKINKLES